MPEALRNPEEELLFRGNNEEVFCLFIYLFIYGRIRSLLLPGLSLVAASWSYSSLRCTGFSSRWLLLLRSMGSRRAGFSSCSTWAQ